MSISMMSSSIFTENAEIHLCVSTGQYRLSYATVTYSPQTSMPSHKNVHFPLILCDQHREGISTLLSIQGTRLKRTLPTGTLLVTVAAEGEITENLKFLFSASAQSNTVH